MKRKYASVVVLLLAVVIGLTGCAQLKDIQLVRKPKADENKLKRYYAVRPYDVKPSLELYTKRYIFWKSWNKDLNELLEQAESQDVNHKKIVVAIEQEVSNLIDMRDMLVDEKAEELQKYIEELTEVEMILKKEKLTRGNQVQIRRTVQNAGRQIKLKFSYNKVQDDIASEFRDEPEEN